MESCQEWIWEMQGEISVAAAVSSRYRGKISRADALRIGNEPAFITAGTVSVNRYCNRKWIRIGKKGGTTFIYVPGQRRPEAFFCSANQPNKSLV